MLHRIQLTFVPTSIMQTNVILNNLKSLYTYVGFAPSPQTLPIKSGEFFITKEDRLFAVVWIEEVKSFTEADISILTSTTV